MVSEDFELVKLKLLTLSQQRLQAAQTENWSQLHDLDLLWQPLLTESIQLHGQSLQPILSKLNQDNEAVISLVESGQQELSQTRKKDSKKLSQVKQYLK